LVRFAGWLRVSGIEMKILFLAMAVGLPLSGQESVQTVEREATPGEYRDAEGGLTLRLPGGFGFLARQETLTLFGSKITPGVIFLEAGESFSEAELVAAAREGYQEEGVALRPSGSAQRLQLAHGVGLAFPVEGKLEGQGVKGLLVGMRSREGRCYILLAATTPEAWPKLQPVAAQLAGGIGLNAPQAPAGDPQTRSYFTGTRLTYYFSRSSYSSTGVNHGGMQSTERIYLCGDGSFHYGEQTRASFDLPQAMGYSRSGDNSAGRWVAVGSGQGAQLTLSFHDGRVWRYNATRMGSEVLYLNGSKYFRSGQNRCR
jgi:hypothetical protein